MSEHPIIMQGWGVRAILGGKKTQTRRVVKPQPDYHEGTIGAEYFGWRHLKDGKTYINMTPPACPYGQPGDLLWVRETWLHYLSTELEMAGFKGGTMTHLPDGRSHWNANDEFDPTPNAVWRKRPAIHMPRWASRLTIRITDVRVQRVQEVTNADIQAEGTPDLHPLGGLHVAQWHERFRSLWNSINGKRGYSWESNPWVWVLKFEVAA